MSWPITKLGQLAEFKNGLNFSKNAWGAGLKIIGVSDFKDRIFPDYSLLDEINPAGVVRGADYLDEGDFLFVRSNGNRDLIGRSLFIENLKEKVSHSGFTIRARFTSAEVYRHFFIYVFRSSLIRTILTAYGGGTNINNLNQGILSKLDVPLPPLPTQRKIAAILTAYDDLIETNKRRIALLEKMAEELYREWFVRMRFPGHQNTKFVKGVPEGWGDTQFGKIARFTMGQSPKSEFYNEIGDGLPFHQGVGTYGDRFPNTMTYCSVAGRRATKGDILFSVRAPVGRLNIADCDMIIGRGLAAIRHVDDKNSYLYYLMKTVFSSEDMIGNGAIFNSVGKDELSRFALHGHPEDLVQGFEDVARPIDNQIENLIQATATLTHTRDLLLPRLISGKLSVEDLDIQFPPSMREEATKPKPAHA